MRMSRPISEVKKSVLINDLENITAYWEEYVQIET